jgi:hypothetical protein
MWISIFFVSNGIQGGWLSFAREWSRFGNSEPGMPRKPYRSIGETAPFGVQRNAPSLVIRISISMIFISNEW